MSTWVYLLIRCPMSSCLLRCREGSTEKTRRSRAETEEHDRRLLADLQAQQRWVPKSEEDVLRPMRIDT